MVEEPIQEHATKPEAQGQEASTHVLANSGTVQSSTHTHGSEGTAQARAHSSDRPDNTVYVGKKGVMGYVLAVVTQFNNGAKIVTIKARGKVISHAVDVAEIVRNRFMPDVKVSSINIKTEELTSEDGSLAKVSAMEIALSR